MTNINPLKVFGDDLLDVQNAARYLGGEYGQIVKKGDNFLNFTMAFPDLYEIGMSNQAIKIIYNGYIYRLYIFNNDVDINFMIDTNRKMLSNTLISEIISNRNGDVISVYNGISYINQIK